MHKNFIIQVIDLLRSNDFYGGGEEIEIAKGKNQMATSTKIALRKIKRKYYAKNGY